MLNSPLGVGAGAGGGGDDAGDFWQLERFATARGTPLSTFLSSPGRGVIWAGDPNSRLSVAGGVQVWSGATSASGTGIATSGFPNLKGLMFAIDLFGMDGNNAGNNDGETRLGVGQQSFGGTGLRGLGWGNNGFVPGITSSAPRADELVALTDPDQRTFFIMRNPGLFILRQEGAGNILLEHVDVTGLTSALDSVILQLVAVTTDVRDFQVDNLRVVPLGTPWSDDAWITDILSGAISAATAFTHEADCVISFTMTTRPSAGSIQVKFRIQDATNFWSVEVDSAGGVIVVETVAGTPTTRITSAVAVSNGQRIQVKAHNERIQLCIVETHRGVYASAANFKTETDGEVTSLGTGGAVSNLYAHPRVISGAALTALSAYD